VGEPFERPENIERLDNLAERISFDPDARREYNTLQAQMQQELMRHELDTRIGGEREALRLEATAGDITRNAYQRPAPSTATP